MRPEQWLKWPGRARKAQGRRRVGNVAHLEHEITLLTWIIVYFH